MKFAREVSPAVSSQPLLHPNRAGKVECVICPELLDKFDLKSRFRHANDHAIDLKSENKNLKARLNALLSGKVGMT